MSQRTNASIVLRWRAGLASGVRVSHWRNAVWVGQCYLRAGEVHWRPGVTEWTSSTHVGQQRPVWSKERSECTKGVHVGQWRPWGDQSDPCGILKSVLSDWTSGICVDQWGLCGPVGSVGAGKGWDPCGPAMVHVVWVLSEWITGDDKWRPVLSELSSTGTMLWYFNILATYLLNSDIDVSELDIEILF